MTVTSRAWWLIPAGLIVLSVIPVIAGSVRLVQLALAVPVTPENARFFAAPWSFVLHFVSSVVYCVLGAFQFAPEFRRRHLAWHRMAGRVLVPCGLVAALTALWMTEVHPAGRLIGPLVADFDGHYLYLIRLLVGSAMTAFLCLGLSAILRRDVSAHRAWMMRAYALALGAGTQVFTHVPWFVFPNIQGELARTVLMGAGWAINLALAEWLIRRAGSSSSGKRLLAGGTS